MHIRLISRKQHIKWYGKQKQGKFMWQDKKIKHSQHEKQLGTLLTCCGNFQLRTATRLIWPANFQLQIAQKVWPHMAKVSECGLHVRSVVMRFVWTDRPVEGSKCASPFFRVSVYIYTYYHTYTKLSCDRAWCCCDLKIRSRSSKIVGIGELS